MTRRVGPAPKPSQARRKRRLDALLVERGLAESRTRAQALVMAGRVFSGARRMDKPGLSLAPDSALEVRGGEQWVSRGGLKLAHALHHFGLDPADRVALDVGASTGGFTDVLLARGVARVYAVDVGYGQIHERIRHNPRVILRERTNARYLSGAEVPEAVTAIVCDVSFIRLETVLPAPLALAAAGAWLIALIKPQFEVGRGAVGKGGIVRDPALHEAVCRHVAAWLAALPGWLVLGLCPSPITGQDGNREFLIAARRDA
ncbi:MAG: TlyA family RNA methyltransferase [Alphaproteobacteria bacterium]|nr:TlyA family RNA methyltransferase [Alphaproteobacteria bacterium]